MMGFLGRRPPSLPKELIPEAEMTVSRFREYVTFVLSQEYIKPDFSIERIMLVEPGDTVEFNFVEWQMSFLIKIIEDDERDAWEQFDNEREKWEMECQQSKR